MTKNTFWSGHPWTQTTPDFAALLAQRVESGRTLPHSKTWAFFASVQDALALWSAAVLRRFFTS
jgi:hypothetical protein